MAQILVVEDDVVINQVICEFLLNAQHEVVSCTDGKQALAHFHTQPFDLILLDIMIPEISGLELLQQIRLTSDVPIMMLTAIDDEAKQLFSFNHKISDYVVKPFSPLILMKRIENILAQSTKASSISTGEITIDFEKALVYVADEIIRLTKKEYEIVAYLFKHQGKVVARETLMIAVWGYSELDSRVLDNHMKNIRKKIPQLKLKTVIGRGYQLEEA